MKEVTLEETKNWKDGMWEWNLGRRRHWFESLDD